MNLKNSIRKKVKKAQDVTVINLKLDTCFLHSQYETVFFQFLIPFLTLVSSFSIKSTIA